MSNRQKLRRRKPGNYLGDLVALYRSGLMPVTPGAVSIVNVRHDADCPKLRGGECRCVTDLEMELRPTPRGVN